MKLTDFHDLNETQSLSARSHSEVLPHIPLDSVVAPDTKFLLWLLQTSDYLSSEDIDRGIAILGDLLKTRLRRCS